MKGKTDQDGVDIKRLNVKEVIIKTIEVYRAGFLQFIALSAISYLPALFILAAGAAIPYSFLIAIAAFVLSIAAIYIRIRAEIGTYLLAKIIIQGERLAVKETFRRSKGLFGTYFAVVLIYITIIALPAIGMALSYELIKDSAVKYGLILLLAIPFTFLFIRYYFALASALICRARSGEFESSKRLVSGDFRPVFFVVFLTYGIPLGISQLLSYFVTDAGVSIIIAGIDMIVQILTAPVSVIAAVIMYLMLNENKKVDTIPLDSEDKV